MAIIFANWQMIRSLRTEMNIRFATQDVKIDTMQTTMYAGFEAVRGEMSTDSKEVRADISGIYQRLSHIEGLLKCPYEVKEEPDILSQKQKQEQEK